MTSTNVYADQSGNESEYNPDMATTFRRASQSAWGNNVDSKPVEVKSTTGIRTISGIKISTNLSDFSPTVQKVFADNGKSQGMTAQEYLESRHGASPTGGAYGDSIEQFPDAYLTDEEYAAAQATGKLASAINAKHFASASWVKSFGNDTGGIGGLGSGSGARGSGSGTGSSATSTTDSDPVTQAKQEATRTALEDFTNQLSSVGLTDLVKVIDAAIKNNQTTAQIKDTVRASDAYATRFPGMKALQKQGRAINEATYISMEQGYLQTLHAYGLDVKTFGTTSALGEQIANLTSPSEFSTRVDDAANRVNKNPDVLAALNTYYNVDKATAIAYLLSPKQGMDLINKQVRASEIGAAASAASYKFNLDMNTAESLIPQIGTEDLTTLKKEFGTAGIEAQTQSRLAQVEGAAYDPNQAIQAAVVGNAQAQLESQRRAQRETQTRFGGQGSQVSRNSTVGSI